MRKVGIDLDKVGIPTLHKKSTGQFRNFTDTYLGMDKKYNSRHIKRGKGNLRRFEKDTILKHSCMRKIEI